MTYRNLTPHEVVLNDGTVYPESGIVAGIQEINSPVIDGVRQDELLGITNLPEVTSDTIFIVSMPTLLGLRANGSKRTDVVTPITRGEKVKKNDKGWIISVSGLRTF